MALPHRRIAMPVTIKFGHSDIRRMVVLVVTAVDAAITMLKPLVCMVVQLSQMSPQSDSYKDFGDDERHRDGFADLAETSIKLCPIGQ